MVDAKIGIAECPTPTDFVDNEEVVTGVGTVLRQRVSDPETHDALLSAISELQDILTALQGTIDVNVTDAVINVDIDNEVEIKNDVDNPIPVSGTVDLSALTLAALENITAIVSGTVALDAPTLAALETISVANFPATQNVSGTVEITNDVGSPIPVSGTFWQATQPVSIAAEVEVKNDSGNALSVAETTGLVPKVFDYIDLSYTGDQVTGVVYKTGGAGGTTVATLALAYAGDLLDTVTRT